METIFTILFVVFILGMIKATVWSSISETIHDGIFNRIWNVTVRKVHRNKSRKA